MTLWNVTALLGELPIPLPDYMNYKSANLIVYHIYDSAGFSALFSSIRHILFAYLPKFEHFGLCYRHSRGKEMACYLINA